MRASCLSASPRGRKGAPLLAQIKALRGRPGGPSGSRSSSASAGSSWPASTPGRARCTGSASAPRWWPEAVPFVLAAAVSGAPGRRSGCSSRCSWSSATRSVLFESVLNAYLAELPDATVPDQPAARVLRGRGAGRPGAWRPDSPPSAPGGGRSGWCWPWSACRSGRAFCLLSPRGRGLLSQLDRPPDRDNAPPLLPRAACSGASLRERSVLLGSAMLLVYVGVELSVGSWGFSYLVQGRELTQSLAGWLGQRVLARTDPGPVPDQAPSRPGSAGARSVL